MRDQIIQKATDLFINLGFKSVTMDDIANELGISKKTIYVHFSNKTKLVESTTLHMFETISCGIDHICSFQKNPIEEIFEIKHFVMDHLKNEKSSPQYQLQKYYPQIFKTLKAKQFDMMKSCVTENLNRGVLQGLYRDSLNVEFISRVYINSIITLKNKDVFPLTEFSMNTLMDYYLEYHLRGICTAKGLEKLTHLIQPVKTTNNI